MSENNINTELYNLCFNIFFKTTEILSNDKNKSISQIKQIVFDLLYDEIKDTRPQYSEEDLNEFIDFLNAMGTYFAKTYEGSESEIKSFKEKMDLFELTSLDGETIYEDDEDKIVTHVIYDEIASIIFFYLGYTVHEKEIKIADLGCYLPDNRGLDTNYEFANGLIAREIMSFWENNQQFQNWHKVKAYLPFSSQLETMIFNNKYHDISYFDYKKLPENLDAVIINVPYISIPYQYDTQLRAFDKNVGRIDIPRFEKMLKDALSSLSVNGSIFLVFRMMDIFSHEEMGRFHHLHLGIADDSELVSFPESPSFLEWSQLYSIFEKYNLTVDSIIKTDDAPNYDAPSFEYMYYDTSGIVILRNKGTFNRPFYSVISLAESYIGVTDELLKNLMKTISVGSKFNIENLVAEYFNTQVEFNGYINDTRNREIFYKKKNLQLAQGFRELSGKYLIKRINQYDVNSNTGFEETENSIFIPLDGNLLFLTYITYSIDEFEKELVDRKVKYKHLDWSNVPWHAFIMKLLGDPTATDDKKENVKTVLYSFNNCQWDNYDFFDITQFGFEIRDNAVFYEGKLIQELLLELNDENDSFASDKDVKWALKKQVLCSNVFEAVLNPKVIYPAYLKLLLKTNAGELYFRDLGYKKPELSRIIMFLNTKLVIPSIGLQIKILEHDNYLEAQKQQLTNQKKTFYDYIGCGTTNYETFSLLNKYDFGTSGRTKLLLDTLPQPIASVLYIDECEDNTARKNINYYHLFEAITHFHATVSLSMIKKKSGCEKIFNMIVNDTILNGFTPNTRKRDIRADFGLWTKILEVIDERCNDHIPFDVQKNKELLLLLNKARDTRNRKMGHAPRWSEVIEKEINDSLANLANEIINCFIQLYNGFELVAGPFRREEADEENNTAYIHCFKAMGANPRFKREKLEVKGYTKFMDHRLYLAEQGTWNKPTELLPLLNYMPLCEDDDRLKSLGYFHTANLDYDGIHDNRFVIWCSCDCGEFSTTTKKFSEDPVSRDLINFLRPYWENKTKK